MIRLGVLIIFFAILFGCGDAVGPDHNGCDLQCQMAKSPYPNYEAEAAAVYLGKSIVAQESEYWECLRAFEKLRETFKEFDSTRWFKFPEFYFYPETTWFNPVNITFAAPVSLGLLRLSFYKDSIGQTVLDSTYRNWDSLNAFYGLDSITYFTIPEASFISVSLFFHGRLNGQFFEDSYRQLPGVWSASNNRSIYDGYNLFIGRDDFGKICFLANFGWDDCMAGCINHKYYYFKQEWNHNKRDFAFVFVGSYLNSDPEPEWWPEACQLKDDYYNYAR
jgi:hypothetical protein